MMKTAVHTSFWQTTDFMVLVVVTAGTLLDFMIPEALPTPALLIQLLGGSLVIAGVTLIAFAKKAFRREKQPTCPARPTTRIVTRGIFNYTRNPIYLGIVIGVVGIGITFDNGWIVLLDIPLAIVIHRLLILPEERYLIARFGDEYPDYMKRVRRWL